MRVRTHWASLIVLAVSASPVLAQGRADEARARDINPTRQSAQQRAIESRQQITERARAGRGNQAGAPENVPHDPATTLGPQAGAGRLPEAVRQRQEEIRNRLDAVRPDRSRGPVEGPAFAVENRGMRPFAAGQATADREDADPSGRRMSDEVSHGRNRLAAIHADRLLSQRLAQIDRMRDRALAAEDLHLLEVADHLEALARDQYARRVAGRQPTEGASTESAPPGAETPAADGSAGAGEPIGDSSTP